jgi:Domain of unknown function (DUF397)
MSYWRKSTHSECAACVEAAGPWVKASVSFSNGNCAELAACTCGDGVLVRDSKDPGGPRLAFTAAAWKAFTDLLRT